MKKTKIISVMIALIALSTTACKKGENDPVLSLKSRTSRLVGTWKLVNGSETIIDYDAGNQETSTTVITDDGALSISVFTFQDQSGSVTNAPQSFTHTLEYTFEKDGSFNYSDVFDGDSQIDKGYWFWGGKSKTQDLKKKEVVVITITETNDGQIDTYAGTAIQVDGSFQLDRLTKKELTLIVDEKRTKSNGDIFSRLSTLKFEKQ